MSTTHPDLPPREPADREPRPEPRLEPQAGQLPGDTIESADTLRLPGPLHRVYRFFISKRTGILLILAMSLLTLWGTLVPQTGQQTLADDEAYASWLESVRPGFKGWYGVLDAMHAFPVIRALGLFDVFGSWAFKLVNVLLCISILCCVVHRIPLLWKRATRPTVHVTEGFFAHAGIHHDITTTTPVDEAVGRVRETLRGRRYRVIDDPRGPGVNVYADKFRWPPFGTIVAHIAFVIILLGVLLTANTGFSEDDLAVPIGSRVDVGHGTGMQIEATSFQDSYYDDGRPKDYVSHLVLYQDGRKVAEQDTRVNEPLRHEGVKFFQASFGFASAITVADDKGTVLYEGGVPMQYTTADEQNSFGKAVVPGKGVDAFVIAPASGRADPDIAPGQVAIKVQPSDRDETIGTKVLSPGETVTIGDLRYTFHREQQYTGLMVSRDPGATYVWIGSFLIMAGMCTTMFLRHRRLWVRVTPAEQGSRVRVASAERHDTAYDDWVAALVDDLCADLGGSPTDPSTHTRRPAADTVGA